MNDNNYDCRLKCLSKLLEDYGHKFSPSFIFGIGEGYTFKYWVEKTNRFPLLIISGREIDLEYKFLTNVGISFQKVIFNSLEKISCNMSDKKIFVNTDRYYLPYLDSYYPNSHFGRHSVILNKIINEDYFEVYDALLDDEFLVLKENLFEAMSSKIEYFPPLQEGFYITNSHFVINKNRLCKIVIANLTEYLNNEKQGIRRLVSFRKQLVIIKNLLANGKVNERFYKFQVKFLLSFIREFESSHSLYRQIYVEFLEEIQNFLDINLSHSISSLDKVAKIWKEIGSSGINDYESCNLHLNFVIKSLSIIETIELECIPEIIKVMENVL